MGRMCAAKSKRVSVRRCKKFCCLDTFVFLPNISTVAISPAGSICAAVLGFTDNVIVVRKVL